MTKKGNALVGIILVIAISCALFLSVPLGGGVGLFREAMISFIFKKPPRFLSLVINVDDTPRTIKAGETLKIAGGETLVITKVNANTFFESYLTADIAGFGKSNDVHEPVDTSLIRRQLIDAGIRSIPIEINYIEHTIAKVPLEIELTEQDFIERVADAKGADEKIAVLRNAHANFPRSTSFLDDLDRLLAEKGEYDSLVGIYKAIVELDPDNVPAMARLSRYYVKLGMYEEALGASRPIAAMGRATATTYRRMAFAAGQLGLLEERITFLKAALKQDPGNDEIILDLAKTYEQGGSPARALALYRESAATARKKDILVPAIEDALQRKDYRGAESVLKRYVEIYPKDVNAFAQLAFVEGKLGHAERQLTYYRRAVALAPQDKVLLFNLAAAYEKAGKKSAALKTYQRVLKLSPKDSEALPRAAALALALKHHRDAYRYYDALVSKSKKKAYLKGLVSAALGLHDHDKIIAACKRYLGAFKDYDVALAMAYAYEGRAAARTDREARRDLNAALEAYRLALKIRPASQKAQEKIPELRIRIIKLKKLT